MNGIGENYSDERANRCVICASGRTRRVIQLCVSAEKKKLIQLQSCLKCSLNDCCHVLSEIVGFELMVYVMKQKRICCDDGCFGFCEREIRSSWGRGILQTRGYERHRLRVLKGVLRKDDTREMAEGRRVDHLTVRSTLYKNNLLAFVSNY